MKSGNANAARMQRLMLTCIAAVLTALGVVGAAAASDGYTIRPVRGGGGLDNPRGIALGPGGRIVVAEAGRGAANATAPDAECIEEPEFGRVCFGKTGAVTQIRRGRQKTLARLPSMAGETGDEANGPNDVAVSGRGTVFALIGGGPPEVSKLLGKLVRVRKDGSVRVIRNISAFERANNPDADVCYGLPSLELPCPPEEPSEMWYAGIVDSNPYGLSLHRGGWLVADAGANAVLRVRRPGRTRVLSVLPPVETTVPPLPFIPEEFHGAALLAEPVPTAIVPGPDQAFYAAELTGFPFPPGASTIYRIDARTGATTPYASGFTNVIDIAFDDDGDLYVLEIDHDGLLGEGELGALHEVNGEIGARRLVRGDTETLVVNDPALPTPGGIAVSARNEDRVFVTTNATSAGAGRVVQISLED